jgi:phage shock protein PspC (stress-responsive transcriptional regulator)
MNLVITINLNGNAYQLEKNGYDALREYLENAARGLEGNPDRDEIIADIEQAIADKFRAVLGSFKTVVIAREVAEIIKEMGPVQDASASADEAATGAADRPASARPAGAGTSTAGAGRPAADGEPAPATKRLYKINEGAMIAGVCNGLAAYLHVDVTVIRILFAVLTVFTWGVGLLLYVVMVLLVPVAHTPAEKAAAGGGSPSTAEEFIRRARQGYYEGMKTLNDRKARREWKRRFKQEMRGWRRNFGQEMRAQTFQWGQNWRQHWAQPAVPMPGSWVVIPLLALVSLVITLAGFYAVASLVATGSVLGVSLPATIPLWGGVVILLVALNLVLWPLKAMRHSFYFHGAYGPAYHGPLTHLVHSFVWVALLVLAVWVADHHIPQIHAALDQLRPPFHQALDSFRQWWAAH